MIVSCFSDLQNKIGVLLPVSPVNRRFPFHAYDHIRRPFCMRQGNPQTIALCQVQIG